MATINVVKQPAKPFRTNSARDLYFQRVCKYDGKTLDAFVKSVEKDVPSVPGKGKLAGKPEPVNGWLNYFRKQGLITITD